MTELAPTLDDIISNPRARLLAEDTLRKMNIRKMSYAELQAVRNQVFDSLTNDNLGEIEQQASLAINLALNTEMNRLGGYSETSLSSNNPEALQQGHANMVANAEYELEQAQTGGNHTHIEQAQRLVNNLKNVDRSLAGQELQPVFDATDDKGRERWIAGGQRDNVTVVKTSEDLLAAAPGEQ